MSDDRWQYPSAELGPTSSVPMKVREGLPLGKVSLAIDDFDEQPAVGGRVWVRAHDFSASVVGVVTRILVEVELDAETAQAYEPVPRQTVRAEALRRA